MTRTSENIVLCVFIHNCKMVEYISAVYLFSYWIFIWFLVYWTLKQVFRVNWFPSPKLALLIAEAQNIVLFAYFIMQDAPTRNLFVFAIINVFMKMLPIYLLRDTPIYDSDIVWLFLLYIVYLLVGFFFYGGMGFFDMHTKIVNAYVAKDNQNMPKTYGHHLVENLLDRFLHYFTLITK